MIQTDKEKAIAAAMAKLSPEEQKLLGLATPKTPDADSTITITLNYTIGSSSGEYTTEIPDIRRDNPYLPIL